ncbi:squalene/phytoene synthase family protein [Albidovulum sediminis]|uniref:Squalene/phytoene synthase family protein n=1 Tax=Albidovulum sediminis TaxID=3066345 RepID=A0ABT2NIF8_9RHOB|nr:squalene/phytoene synthase family protein [Defluviimonas sediminis]MCT8328704.1 squalene/phytoene synthase family protein [Defluviimonas sediminis]
MTPAEIARLADAVREGDPRRFAATMAAPAATRPRLWALYALNLEIARAPWASDQPLIAEMRLQWWIDAIAAPEGQGGGALAILAPLMLDLPDLRPLLLGAAEARRRDAWPEPFADEADLGAYLDATAGNLMWAAARLLGAPAAAEAPVRDFAWGAGLATWLAAVPALAARGRHPLPDMTPEAVTALARRGLDRIARARALRARVPATAAPALLPGWQAAPLLRLAAHQPSRVAEGRLATSEARARASLALRALTGRW